MSAVLPHIKVADEVWIATALLHRENPAIVDFTLAEIVKRAAKEEIIDRRRPGVYVHVVQHSVANRPPNPGPYRMLYETRPGYRRLYRDGDDYHPGRDSGKIVPEPDEIPIRYGDLLKWYEHWRKQGGPRKRILDPLLALYGSGREIWADEHADEYVARLREGWE
jgi:hypothetical protein